MDRREFLTAAAAATVLPAPGLALAQSATRQFIELRRYHLFPERSSARSPRSSVTL